MDGNQPVSPVTLQMLNSLIDTQTRLRDAAEARWSFAREALFNLARLVASDWLEESQQQKGNSSCHRWNYFALCTLYRFGDDLWCNTTRKGKRNKNGA